MLCKNRLFRFCGTVLGAFIISLSVNAYADSNSQSVISASLANLADGNYQLCSQPQPLDWHGGDTGVCFNFVKTGERVSGYYGYPRTDNFICVRGQVNGSLVKGEALAISWGGRQWMNIPKHEFTWDEEGHLAISDGKITRTITDERGGRTEWILFSDAKLDTKGFYRSEHLSMTPPSQLCQWYNQSPKHQ
ncbi:hypothetical protein [Pseudanabaena mucicola]|uniref:Uncharacterized protein n=1 Tax=Pseudanabaena mucicola FACHB-723 TaxID=2692860 RepID=A0ABR8A2X4_9CYAN|nr:hypothetical protein [Pseudanabaena mucicola]MBD2189958.1 hypothetical protein [Pseudanabaena mucicola FACHB-723]